MYIWKFVIISSLIFECVLLYDSLLLVTLIVNSAHVSNQLVHLIYTCQLLYALGVTLVSVGSKLQHGASRHCLMLRE